MTERIRKGCIPFFLFALLLCLLLAAWKASGPDAASADPDLVTRTLVYRTDSEEDKRQDFEEEMEEGGIKYTLEQVKYEVMELTGTEGGEEAADTESTDYLIQATAYYKEGAESVDGSLSAGRIAAAAAAGTAAAVAATAGTAAWVYRKKKETNN